MKYYHANFNYIQQGLKLQSEDVFSCSHMGRCDNDVAIARQVPYIKKQLDKIDVEQLKKELTDYGAWTFEQLQNHDENLTRILWLAAGNIQDEIHMAKK